MFRYAFLAAPSAVADAPKAAVNAHFADFADFTDFAAEAAVPAAFPAAVVTAAAAPVDGARS
ncbi:hypothetical protein GCM10010329_59650 [Streptomyces spiroverticillatus]|uniref:Uncharacterized protein n=1 Tax=Streptomyces finlayi TaxID=67296 RepID=A0A918X3Q0_9ACTN|nr:hypothetical protein [Streptomyces finlayi]GHA28534.1 hypothetical protein GCM10010329_59650 [Streptomyces spiroverticillatus]GHD09213.1 hypothetical protein GCM10010334_63310 [Streptomyces finlayi]